MHNTPRVLSQFGRTFPKHQRQQLKQQFYLHVQEQQQQQHCTLFTLASVTSSTVSGLTSQVKVTSTAFSGYPTHHHFSSQKKGGTFLPSTTTIIPAHFYSKFTAARESLPLGSIPLCEERALDLISNLKETELAAIKLALKKYEAIKQKENFEGDLHGMSQQTVGRIIKKISKQIALLLPHFVQFPKNSEIAETKKEFFRIAHFPNVIGAIDCTHVRIKCPKNKVGHEMAGHFINRKGYYSLNVQIVCDAECKIRDIVARSRGSKHDARIWSECQLKSKLEQTKRQHNGVLLGDGGYPLSTILLTPFRNPSTPKEERYNKCHITTRSKIECLNGQLKSKFRSIFERLRVDLDTAKNIVVAVAVLHNIAKERNSSCTLAATQWRTRFGRPSRVPALGEVDPTGTFCAFPDDWLKKKAAEKAVNPSSSDLWKIFFVNAVPFVGFGFLDNFTMIIAGDYIEYIFGTFMCISTMAAAGLGNTISDVIGIGSAYYIERGCELLGLRPPDLTPIQMEMKSSRRAANYGRIIGITVGCLLGMFPLLFIDRKAIEDERKEEEERKKLELKLKEADAHQESQQESLS